MASGSEIDLNSQKTRGDQDIFKALSQAKTDGLVCGVIRKKGKEARGSLPSFPSLPAYRGKLAPPHTMRFPFA